VLVHCYWSKELSFEAEVGLQRTWSEQAGIKDNTAELFVSFGVRYDFYADDATKSADKINCAAPPPGCN
jgi:hypothetical protein